MTLWKKLAILPVILAFVSADVSISGIDLTTLSITAAKTAEARIGRPLTPLSYAGVARRTTRRVIRRTAIRVNALPAGCVYGLYHGAYYYRCGAGYYTRSSGGYVQIIIN